MRWRACKFCRASSRSSSSRRSLFSSLVARRRSTFACHFWQTVLRCGWSVSRSSAWWTGGLGGGSAPRSSLGRVGGGGGWRGCACWYCVARRCSMRWRQLCWLGLVGGLDFCSLTWRGGGAGAGRGSGSSTPRSSMGRVGGGVGGRGCACWHSMARRFSMRWRQLCWLGLYGGWVVRSST